MDQQHGTGFVIWLTGMTGAGKSTLSHHLGKRFAAAGRPAEVIDGDGLVVTPGLFDACESVRQFNFQMGRVFGCVGKLARYPRGMSISRFLN